mgnify:CR=1 FL=1
MVTEDIIKGNVIQFTTKNQPKVKHKNRPPSGGLVNLRRSFVEDFMVATATTSLSPIAIAERFEFAWKMAGTLYPDPEAPEFE